MQLKLSCYTPKIDCYNLLCKPYGNHKENNYTLYIEEKGKIDQSISLQKINESQRNAAREKKGPKECQH